MSESKKNRTTLFTFNSEKTGINKVPSVTRLLKRGKGEEPEEESADHTTAMSAEASQQQEAQATPPPPPPIEENEPKIISTSGRQLTRTQLRPLRELEQEDLDTADPGGLSWIAHLRKQKREITCLMMLGSSSQAKPNETSPSPEFIATSFFGNSAKPQLWNQMKFHFNWAPDLWHELQSHQYLEFAPPRTQTNVNSYRNIVRRSFGIGVLEWLTLILAKANGQQKAELLAVVSEQSLVDAIEQGLSSLKKAS